MLEGFIIYKRPARFWPPNIGHTEKYREKKNRIQIMDAGGHQISKDIYIGIITLMEQFLN